MSPGTAESFQKVMHLDFLSAEVKELMMKNLNAKFAAAAVTAEGVSAAAVTGGGGAGGAADSDATNVGSDASAGAGAAAGCKEPDSPTKNKILDGALFMPDGKIARGAPRDGGIRFDKIFVKILLNLDKIWKCQFISGISSAPSRRLVRDRMKKGHGRR